MKARELCVPNHSSPGTEKGGGREPDTKRARTDKKWGAQTSRGIKEEKKTSNKNTGGAMNNGGQTYG